MTTPQQFLESLFQEKTAIYAEANKRLEPVYAKYFTEPLARYTGDFLLQNKVREFIDEVKESDGSAFIITSIKRPDEVNPNFRQRYHLVMIDGHWKVTQIDRRCLGCRGTGKSDNEVVCWMCKGKGWIDPRKSNA